MLVFTIKLVWLDLKKCSIGSGLDDSYELGHSYFLKPKNLSKKEISKLWEGHISPLLKEYLRTQYSGKDIETRLKEMKTELIDKYDNSNK